MEKKKLTFKLEDHDYGIARSSGGAKEFKEPLFAFAAPPDKDGIVRAVTRMTYCRESICEYLRQDLRGIAEHKINTKKLHMIVHRRVGKSVQPSAVSLKIFQNQVAAGQRMFNAIEKHYGWPLTRIYPLDMIESQRDVPENNVYHYVTASKRWIKAPAMLSLYTLLFRIAENERRFKFKHRIRSMKSLFDVLDELAVKYSYSGVSYYRVHGKHWETVLNNYDKLFGRRSMKDMYFPSKNAYYFSEGINALCDGDTKDKVLRKTFHSIKEKKA